MSRTRYFVLALLYGLVIAYGSTIIGPTGPHFVPINPHLALSRLIQMPYIENGSDQRSDWMGNLVTLVPLGFLMAGWLSPGRRLMSILGGICALGLCFAFILGVKYAQLYFPPRTVTLNYVVAQTLGAAVGVLLFGVIRNPLGRGLGGLEGLRVVLRIYSGLVLLFLLMPLDFALSATDIIAQLDKLPDSFTMISGEGRPFVVRLAVTLGSMLAMAPIGALLTITGRGRVFVGRSTGAVAWIGFCTMICVYMLTILLISGSPSLPAVGFRTAGIALGAWTMHWLTRQDPDEIKHDLSRLVPWVAPIYLLTLFAVNGLLSFDWLTPNAAAHDFYDLLLYPLFDYYIVSKAQAAKNIAAHIVMYAPIGIMIWLRATQGGGKATAFILAALLSSIVEFVRFLRPGLFPDVNAIPLAGASAWAALLLMPVVWQMLSGVAIGTIALPLQLMEGAVTGPVLDWRERETERRTRRRDRSNTIGDVEEY